jgi:hypothetical protein
MRERRIIVDKGGQMIVDRRETGKSGQERER